MELELIYSKIAYEKARHNMEICHLDCLKIKEQIEHINHLEDLENEKDTILKSYSVKDAPRYQPQKYTKSNGCVYSL